MVTPPRSLIRHLPWILGTAALLLYVLTGARTIQWQDSAQFTYRIGIGDPGNFYGLAMVHPFHFMLGRMACVLFPSNIPWALSGVSALGGAVAVGVTAACARLLTRNTSAVLFSGFSLMIAHTFWRFSGQPEVYTWSAALMMLQIWIYLKTVRQGKASGWIAVFALNGVAWSNHNLALLTLSVWGITFLLPCKSRPQVWTYLPGMALAWITGSMPYLLLIVQEGIQSGDWPATIHSALFGHGFQDQVTTLFPRPAFTLISIGFLALSFPNACPLLILKSLGRIRDNTRSLPIPVYGILLFQLLFFLRYDVIDQYTFLIPVFPLLALCAGTEFHRIASAPFRKAAWILLALQPFVYAVTPGIVRATGALETFARNKPFRDDADYLFWPWRVQDRSALQLATTALNTAYPDGILIIADPMAMHTVMWEQRQRPESQSVILLRPEEYEAQLDAIITRRTVVWAPLRSTDPPPQGWRDAGGVWVAENQNIPNSTAPEKPSTLQP
jgi:hypothetical protein